MWVSQKLYGEIWQNQPLIAPWGSVWGPFHRVHMTRFCSQQGVMTNLIQIRVEILRHMSTTSCILPGIPSRDTFILAEANTHTHTHCRQHFQVAGFSSYAVSISSHMSFARDFCFLIRATNQWEERISQTLHFSRSRFSRQWCFPEVFDTNMLVEKPSVFCDTLT